MAQAGRSLSIETDLDITVDGDRCVVWTEPDCLVVNAPTVSAARALLSGVESLPLSQARLAAGLTQTDLTVEIRVQHATVARVGAAVEPSRLASLAGYDAAVSVRGLAVAVWRQLL